MISRLSKTKFDSRYYQAAASMETFRERHSDQLFQKLVGPNSIPIQHGDLETQQHCGCDDERQKNPSIHVSQLSQNLKVFVKSFNVFWSFSKLLDMFVQTSLDLFGHICHRVSLYLSLEIPVSSGGFQDQNQNPKRSKTVQKHRKTFRNG